MVVDKYKKVWQLVRSPISKHECASQMQLIHPNQPILEKGDQVRRNANIIYVCLYQIIGIYNICSVSGLTCVNVSWLFDGDVFLLNTAGWYGIWKRCRTENETSGTPEGYANENSSTAPDPSHQYPWSCPCTFGPPNPQSQTASWTASREKLVYTEPCYILLKGWQILMGSPYPKQMLWVYCAE